MMRNILNLEYKLLRKFVLVSIWMIGTFQISFAQGGGGDFFRNIGKIYVVVAVVIATFIGIVLYLIYLTNKLKKLEDEINA